MAESSLLLAVQIAAIAAGLMAGIYFAFSSFIMRSFDELGAPSAVAAMNAINRVILRSWFMALFFASTVLFAVLAVFGLISSELPGRWLLVAAGLSYVIGMFVLTAAFNVPLNNQLARVTDNRDEQSRLWQHYYHRWTTWNHARAAFSLVACALCLGFVTRL